MKSAAVSGTGHGESKMKDSDSIQGVCLGEEKVKVLRIEKVKDCVPRLALWTAVQLTPNDRELGTQRPSQQVSPIGQNFFQSVHVRACPHRAERPKRISQSVVNRFKIL